LAAAITASLVIPNSLYIFPAGALAPNQSMPMTFPLLPTMLWQPNVDPVSMLTLAVTEAGRRLSLYSSDCSSKSSQLTKEAIVTAFPFLP